MMQAQAVRTHRTSVAGRTMEAVRSVATGIVEEITQVHTRPAASPSTTVKEAEEALEADGQDRSKAKTFDLDRDGVVSEEEMSAIRREAHLSRPEDVILQTKELLEEHIERKGN